jgi:protein arginine kinase activator
MTPMKCDLCDKPAMVHEVVIQDGKRVELHLCPEHAAAKGLVLPTVPVMQLLQQFAAGAKPLKAQKAAARQCEGCGLTFAEFRQSGHFGCASCYDAFMPSVGAIIERAQSGAVSHRGRAPKRIEGQADRAAARRQLVKEIEAAVAAEQYERAAALQCRLHQLGAQPPRPKDEA